MPKFELPDTHTFFAALKKLMSANNIDYYINNLHVANCTLEDSNDYPDINSEESLIYLTFYVPVEMLASFDDKTISLIRSYAQSLIPKLARKLIYLEIVPDFAGLNVDSIESGINNAGLVIPNRKITVHDGINFRSQPEIKIYAVLKKKKVLFFPNPAAILGGLNPLKKEPDFLVCFEGKWGILEVMGEDYHPDATKDHERARLFKDYGLTNIEFYNASKCKENPEWVVEDFLKRLK